MNDGGPAFPGFSHTDGRGPVRPSANGEWETFVPGMTLRDYFAAAAMTGLIMGTDLEGSTGYPDHERAAAFCYSAADAMLRQRQRAVQESHWEGVPGKRVPGPEKPPKPDTHREVG